MLTFFCSTYRIFSLPEYRVGDIATSDIMVPADVPMQDEEATAIRQEEARNAALPAYRHAAAQAQARVESICRLVSTLRSQLKPLNPTGSPGPAWSFDKLPPEIQANLKLQLSQLLPEPELDSAARFLASNGFSRQLQQALEQALRKANSSLVIGSERDLIREQGRIHVFSGTDSEERTTIPVDQVKTLDSLRQEVESWLPALLRYHELPRQSTSRLVRELLQPNLSFDLQATQATQREAVADVDPVFVVLKRGKVVVRQGDEISSGQLRQIEAIGNLPQESSSPAQVVSLALLIGSLLAVFGYLLRNLWPTHWNFMRLAVLAGTVLVVQIVVLKVFGFIGEALSESLSQNFAGFPDNDEVYFFFALPFALGAMLVTILVDARAALIFFLVVEHTGRTDPEQRHLRLFLCADVQPDWHSHHSQRRAKGRPRRSGFQAWIGSHRPLRGSAVRQAGPPSTWGSVFWELHWPCCPGRSPPGCWFSCCLCSKGFSCSPP